MRSEPVRAIATLVLVLLSSPAFADRLPARSDRLVDYRISVTLDPVAKTLAGRERVTWRNPSTDTVPDLWFHLYLNAFRNSESTFYRESGGQLRGDRMAAGRWGFIDVVSIKLADGTDLTGALRFEHPDDDNANDRTVARLALPQPVPPGTSIALDIEFRAQLPQGFARTGYRRDFYLVGQWFPKLGVYEPAGMRGRTVGGWNCHQFHANSEFYALAETSQEGSCVPGRAIRPERSHESPSENSKCQNTRRDLTMLWPDLLRSDGL